MFRQFLGRVLLTGASIVIAADSRSATLEPDEILRRAEDVRNPRLTYAADFTIHSMSGRERTYEWDASYSMLARGKGGTVILMRTPSHFFGGLVLMTEGRYWMLLPRATKPMELSEAQVVRGDISSGDLARADLTRGYAVESAVEDQLDGVACWRLELRKSSPSVRFSRIVYWIDKRGFLPRRLDHYGLTGTLLKTIDFSDYRKGPLGLRPMRLLVQSHGDWIDKSTLTFTDLRKIRADSLTLAPETLPALRDAALALRDAGNGSDVPLERVLKELAARP